MDVLSPHAQWLQARPGRDQSVSTHSPTHSAEDALLTTILVPRVDTETVLFVLLQHFKFKPTGKPIAWNFAAVQYPTVGRESPEPEMPLKVSLLRP